MNFQLTRLINFDHSKWKKKLFFCYRSIIHPGGPREKFWRTWEEKSVYGRVNQALKIAKVITAYAWSLEAHVRGLIPRLTRTASKSINRNASSNEHESLKEKKKISASTHARVLRSNEKVDHVGGKSALGQHQRALLKSSRSSVLLREKAFAKRKIEKLMLFRDVFPRSDINFSTV